MIVNKKDAKEALTGIENIFESLNYDGATSDKEVESFYCYIATLYQFINERTE